jgi:hypothetical protein
MENGQVDEWLASIDKGERPTLNRFATKPSAGQLALFWFVLAWPALVVTACLFFRRRRIGRKWAFVLAGLVVGYVVLFTVGWGISLALPSILGALAEGNSSLVMPPCNIRAASFVISLLRCSVHLDYSSSKRRQATARCSSRATSPAPLNATLDSTYGPDKDWRLTNQERYLMRAKLVHREYHPTNRETPIPPMITTTVNSARRRSCLRWPGYLTNGYATLDGYRGFVSSASMTLEGNFTGRSRMPSNNLCS